MPLEKKESQIQSLLFAVLQSLFFSSCLAVPVHSFIYSFSPHIFLIDLQLMLGLSVTFLLLKMYLVM